MFENKNIQDRKINNSPQTSMPQDRDVSMVFLIPLETEIQLWTIKAKFILRLSHFFTVFSGITYAFHTLLITVTLKSLSFLNFCHQHFDTNQMWSHFGNTEIAPYLPFLDSLPINLTDEVLFIKKCECTQIIGLPLSSQASFKVLFYFSHKQCCE